MLQKRISQLKAGRPSNASQEAIREAEKTIRSVFRQKHLEMKRDKEQGGPPEEADPVLKAIRDEPATKWTVDQVDNWLARRSHNMDGSAPTYKRLNQFDPVCTKITLYKRVGRKASIAFRCYLRSHKNDGSRAIPFWVKYLDMLRVPGAEALLQDLGWRMCDHYNQYSDGETPWESDGPSSAAEWDRAPERRHSARRARRGAEHRIISRRSRRT